MTGYDASQPRTAVSVLRAMKDKLLPGPIHQFLSEELLTWVSNQIYAQKSPDLYAKYRELEKLYAQCRTQLRTIESACADRDVANRKLAQSNAILVETSRVYLDEIEQLTGELNRLKEMHGYATEID